MRRGIGWLCRPGSDGVTGGRFIARLWDPELPGAEAAKAARAPHRPKPETMCAVLQRAPDLTLERIIDLDPFRLPLDVLFPDARVDALEPAQGWLYGWHLDFASTEVLLGVQSHLLRIGGRIILIDTCVGDCKQRPARPEWHQRSGADDLHRLAAGVHRGDVEVVFCAHLHADHAGWNTRLQGGRWVPTLPRARYPVGRAELRHWMAKEARAPGIVGHGVYADSVLPILEAGLIDEVKAGADLGPALAREAGCLHACDLSGHSPSQLGPSLPYPGGRLLLCGDAVHSPLQLPQPDWSSRFCFAGPEATRKRRALFTDLAESGDLLVPFHLRSALALRVHAEADAWKPQGL
ncbi:MBL fold metallo-hydrolase [Salipiger mangrovisoli]|uniref:MBL fold metallo-hydrolase n=1 Tax=Salipiger mangrovisoli TaxID=2865933 RepID=A0ABR9X037_9RHOB|nr:MBL fold metallo-hydrolase [Salipiger mangrovisoli]MBE9636913.1 MBL fold metallo-hydrolase [Salipiger mangrovisoli]